MNKTTETKPKKPYESPAVLDIPPVTINVGAGDSVLGDKENPDDGGGYS